MVAESIVAAPYCDTSLPVGERVDDLLSHMTLEEKVGQMFHWLVMPRAEDSLSQPNNIMALESPQDTICTRFISHFALVGSVTDVRQAVRWHNAAQRLARSTRLGIPLTGLSDPRHHFFANLGTAAAAGSLSQWPETLGLAAIRDPATTRRFAEMASQETNGTFGEDADLTSELVAAYIRGFQGAGPGLSSSSVACMIKHFPGGGALRKGEDSHFHEGRIQEYPGGQFEYHLRPFRAALEAGAAQVMPAYGVPTGMPEFPEVAFGFNKPIVTDLLRGKLGFQGMQQVRAWGCEDESRLDRVAKILDAGCDQLGGEICSDLIIELVRSGRVAESRIDASVTRILRDKFMLGLFDSPFLDEEQATNSPPSSCKVFLNDFPAEIATARGFTVVGSAKEADLAIVRLQAPYEKRSGAFASTFHAGSLDFSDELLTEVLAICADAPTVVDVYLDRPAVVTPLVGKAAALLGTFGTGPDALMDVLLGAAKPLGKLPFDLPRSMAAVDTSLTDKAHDTKYPAFRFGHGLSYPQT
ncbi:beta-glucosidase C [Microdochium trichocladiopsis]|uniref:beta-glucosidase n=1 Tax=Microdochium trichocladiopsis TaxID=1682393 RepID=A0A9P8Y5D6_9PEZI|nr:beta-glucosidase C [Microdochium trichocladiopsis]KAH7029630.1 beta-glucosidase C [Microdochium trichocladiopsis]